MCAPKRFYALPLFFLALLAATYLYRDWVLTTLLGNHLPVQMLGVPVGVLWWGALGAVLSSLHGVYLHNRSWNHAYDFWHWTRPVFGAFSGLIGCLLFKLLTEAAARETVTIEPAAYSVAAFLIGFATIPSCN